MKEYISNCCQEMPYRNIVEEFNLRTIVIRLDNKLISKEYLVSSNIINIMLRI